MGGLLMALRVRGETVDEITGAVSAMRAKMLRVKAPADAVDVVGTGGDGSGSVNVSTCAAFIVAGAGVPVAKHGNRALSSRSGAADVLSALGVKIDITPDHVGRCVAETGIGFMFAPTHHASMKHAAPVRKELGVRTIFNILGPLTNPAGASHQLIGVGHPGIAGKLAEALARLGSEHAVLVHAEAGLDELGISGPSHVTDYDARRGDVRTYDIDPRELGLELGTMDDLLGGGVERNVDITRAILNGEDGPRRSVTLLNAGAGIFAANAAGSFEEGIALAADAIDSGKALATLERLAEMTQRFAADAAEATR
jgi:anthranilate phosphoribosyltransferase